MPNRVVKCMVITNNEACNFKVAYNDSSAPKMIRHLELKYKMILNKKIETDEREKDPSYLLMMFIITASLPFRCVYKQIFAFCNFLNPNYNLPLPKDLPELACFYYEKQKKTDVKRQL